MKIINYIKKSLQRKIARRFTREYPASIKSFYLEKEGKVDFANWNNPLTAPF